jgi:hypothetical protein
MFGGWQLDSALPVAANGVALADAVGGAYGLSTTIAVGIQGRLGLSFLPRRTRWELSLIVFKLLKVGLTKRV